MTISYHRLSRGCINAIALLFAAWVGAGHVTAQLRVVTYNTANSGDNNSPVNPRAGMATILEAIGSESVGGIATPIDALLLQEQDSSATTTQAIVNLLNGIYGAGTYARATLNSNTFGAGRPGLVYNTNSLQLIQQSTVGNTSSNGCLLYTSPSPRDS